MLLAFLHEPVSKTSPEGRPEPLEAHLHHALAFCREVVTSAFDVHNGFFLDAGIIQCAQQPGTHQEEEIPFPGGQRPDRPILARHRGCRNQGVVVCDLAVLDHLLRVHRQLKAVCKRQCAAYPCRQFRKFRLQLVGQKPAV